MARLKPGQKAITCPFCFETFDAQEVDFRCMNPQCGRQDLDTVLARALGQPNAPLLAHTYPYARHGLFTPRVPVAMHCDACSKESKTRLCPKCHFELSHDAGLIEDAIIAIIGGRDTGKSHYIATLINRLEHEVGENFNLSVRRVGDSTRERFENDFYGPLFRRQTILQATVSATIDVRVKLPMVFRLTLSKGRRRQAFNLSFFDTAGEDMRSLDVTAREARYITAADGIIFLLDPLQIEAVRRQLPGVSLPASDPLSEPTYIIERLRDLFERRDLHLARRTDRAPGKVKVPVAFTLSKSDTLFPFIEPGSLLRRPGEHFGSLNLRELHSIDSEIWSYIEAWTGPGFSRRVQDGFAKGRFFGVSSLGQQPDRAGKVKTVASLRVEDPFLWILYELGRISGK